MSVTRRQALVGTGVTLAATTVAACATYGNKSAQSASSPAPAPAPSGPAPIARVSDVPVGSGVIIGDTVLTQPTPGVFRGFSARCTHAGCTVNQIVDATIHCPCHGSTFNLNGGVERGPAKRPLDPKPVEVEGDSIVLQ
jgi:Rieske Fe-S protein